MDKIIVIAWSIWNHRKNTVFRDWNVQPAHIINLAVSMFHDMRYYNAIYSLFGHDTNTNVQRGPRGEIEANFN